MVLLPQQQRQLEKPMTNSTNTPKTEEQINKEFFEAMAMADAAMAEEQEVKRTRAVQKLFKFKQDQSLDAKSIRMDNIEQASAGFVSGALLASLEERDLVVQRYDAERYKRKYFYTANFDLKLVALLGTQLCRPLAWCDIPLPIDSIANTTAVWKHFRNLARANMSIMNSFNKEQDFKAHWVKKAKAGLETALKAGLLVQDDDGYVKQSEKFLGMCISRSSIAHQKEPITLETRRKERVKTRFNPKKDGTSARVRQALGFVESQSQCVNTWLLDVVVEVRDWYIKNDYILPETFKDGNHVIDGCSELRDEPELFTEYFSDLRGRMYQFSHFGPNPQGADLAKALCYHTIKEITLKGSKAYDVFMDELRGEVLPGGEAGAFWGSDKMMRRMAEAPVEGLKYALSLNANSKGASELPFKKFFTYMDMCKTYVEFEDHGQAICQLGFGPDAKTSGAQLLAILAGDADKARACGLTDLAEKLDDLYEQSAQEVAKLLLEHPEFGNIQPMSRNDIKTPFMAVQYGGGVPSLRYKTFEGTMARIGVPVEQRGAFCLLVIEGIQNALGDKINGLLGSMIQQAGQKLEEENKTWFSYKHIDGFQCTKKGEASVVVTAEHFFISLGDQRQGVIFGATEEAKGGSKGWEVQSRTQGHLQAANFAYYFPVHFIQGLDAVMARTIALNVEKVGLRGYSTIHDQFRVCLNDAPKMMEEVIAPTYDWMFNQNNPLKHLSEQTGMEIHTGNPLEEIPNITPMETLLSENAYYFG